MSKKLKQLVQKTKHTLVYKFEPLIDIYQKYNFYFFRFNKYRKNTPFPKHINIETTNICTNRCPFCYYGNIEKMPKLRLMTKEMFYRIIDELAEINFDGRISLFEINEPLTDPRIVDFVAHVKKKLPNAHQMMVTNGDLLSVEKLEKLFENGIDKLDLNSYNKKNLSRNLKLLKSVKYNPKKLCHYDKTQRFASGHWISRGGNIDKYVRRKVPKDACEFVYAQMVIKSNGDVVTCAADMWRKQLMGNLKNKSLKDVWFGEKFSALRQQLAKKNRTKLPVCSQCDYSGGGGFYSHTN